MSRFLIVLGATALALFAGDFWAKKPYTDWSEKDAARLLTNSPWSHDVVVVLEGGPARRLSGGRGGHGSTGGVDTGDMSPMSGSAGGSGEITGGARAARPENMAGANGPDASSITLHVRWQSALPIRQALVVSKLGHEKAGSDEARKFVAQPMPYYVVAVAGLPHAMIARISDGQMPDLTRAATLVRKGKAPIAAEGAQKIIGEPGALAFLFPKTPAITMEDKEVEFVSKVGRLELKHKFKLKDMVIGAKLEL
ncbi:MAG TPA: hypothetical protein VEU96_12525 [Bryobacteraceae bacterium]|nr:hypothetical protein [Bryobacteraceae bacterium]